MDTTTILMIMTGIGIITPFIANISQSVFSNVKRSKCCGCDVEMRDKENNIEDKTNNTEIQHIEEMKKKIEVYNNIYKK